MSSSEIFLKWANSELSKIERSIEKIEDFSDGISICKLYECISGPNDEQLGKYNERPRMLIQKKNNLSIALKPVNNHIKKTGINLQYSPEKIADGDKMTIMGILWILISMFVFPPAKKNLSKKRTLLKWVQKITKKYLLTVKDFKKDFKDGLALCAILHYFDNDCLDFNALSHLRGKENLETAFSIAEKWGIPRIIEPEDVSDEKGITLYLSLLYNLKNNLKVIGGENKQKKYFKNSNNKKQSKKQNSKEKSKDESNYVY